MKTIKSLITLLLLTIGVAVQAQTVVIEKTDGTSDEYDLADIDSVAYEPVEIYYYYWGVPASKPTSADEMKNATSTSAKILSVTVPADNTNSLLFMYPSEWGTAEFKDPTTGAGFGTVKNYGITGYNAVLLPTVNATWCQGMTFELLWK